MMNLTSLHRENPLGKIDVESTTMVQLGKYPAYIFFPRTHYKQVDLFRPLFFEGLLKFVQAVSTIEQFEVDVFAIMSNFVHAIRRFITIFPSGNVAKFEAYIIILKTKCLISKDFHFHPFHLQKLSSKT